MANIMQYKMSDGRLEQVGAGQITKLTPEMVRLTAVAHIGDNWRYCILSDGRGTVLDRYDRRDVGKE